MTHGNLAIFAVAILIGNAVRSGTGPVRPREARLSKYSDHRTAILIRGYVDDYDVQKSTKFPVRAEERRSGIYMACDMEHNDRKHSKV